MPTHPKSTTLTDKIYGTHTLEEAILRELLETPQVQRLKHINQLGVPEEFFCTKNFSRYEHSVGVLLLLKLLGASPEEQVAGLLHDVSHTAFSHVIDALMGDTRLEDFQDRQHYAVITSPGLARILTKYGYDPKRISRLGQFTLLDCPIPGLCADRLDYALRQMPPASAKRALAKVVHQNGRIVFQDQPSATDFATMFLKLQVDLWGGFESAFRYNLLAGALKAGLANGDIVTADLWTDDAKVIAKLTRSHHAGIHTTLQLLRCKSLAHLPRNGEIVFKKFRYVDPLFLTKHGETLKVSDVDANFKAKLTQAQQDNAKGIRLPLIDSYLPVQCHTGGSV
jgi:hypothetical protein